MLKYSQSRFVGIINDKTSIGYFEVIPGYAVWDEQTSQWWVYATNLVETLGKSKTPRKYWYTIKRRNPQLIAICKQLKLAVSGGKVYITGVVADEWV